MKKINSSQYSHQTANGNYQSREEKVLGRMTHLKESPDIRKGYRTGLQRFYERYPYWNKELGIGAMVEEDLRRLGIMAYNVDKMTDLYILTPKNSMEDVVKAIKKQKLIFMAWRGGARQGPARQGEARQGVWQNYKLPS